MNDIVKIDRHQTWNEHQSKVYYYFGDELASIIQRWIIIMTQIPFFINNIFFEITDTLCLDRWNEHIKQYFASIQININYVESIFLLTGW